MALPVIPIQAETPQQANPFATSLGMLNDAIKGSIVNQYLPQQLQAQILQQQMQNQMIQPETQMANQFAQAKLANMQIDAPYKQALMQEIFQGKIPLNQAMSAMYGTEAQTGQELMPYKVQEQQGKVFSDPILQRLFETGLANKTGQIPSQYLGSVGLPTNQQVNNQATQGMPNLGSVIAGGIQNRGLNPIANNLPSGANPVNSPKGFGGDTFQNFALFGSPLNPIQMAQMKSGAETAGKTGVTTWNDALNHANSDSDLGNQLEQATNQFKAGYDKATYKGPSLGTLPATGWKTALLPGNLTPEQDTDNASQNLAALRAKLIAGGRVTNYEFQFVQNLKPNRAMTPQTAQMTSDFLSQRAKQMQEMPKFLEAAQQQGLDVRTAQNLWNMYRQQRPVYNFQTRTPYNQFIGSWRDYLNPDAVQAAQTGQSYLSVPNFSNKKDLISWYNTLPDFDKQTFRQEYSGGIK